MSKMRRYTVLTNKTAETPNPVHVFPTLLEARKVGFQYYRRGLFTSLTNINGVVLNLM